MNNVYKAEVQLVLSDGQMFDQGMIIDPTEQGNSVRHDVMRGCMQSCHRSTKCVLTEYCYLAAVAATAGFLAFWATPVGLFGSLWNKLTLA